MVQDSSSCTYELHERNMPADMGKALVLTYFEVDSRLEGQLDNKKSTLYSRLSILWIKKALGISIFGSLGKNIRIMSDGIVIPLFGWTIKYT
jgi:hypothetical protein